MCAQKFKRICVIGLGYIGLPTAAMFASRKIEVVGVDINENTVDTINRGDTHIVEPDLDVVVRKAVKAGYLRASNIPEQAEAFLIAVPTPFKEKNHHPDLRFIEAAARSIAPFLRKGNIVILESTSPVGTTEVMAQWLAEARPELTFPQTAGEESDIRIAHSPERVLPGKVMQELIANDRVIGGMTPKCSTMAKSLYSNFIRSQSIIASSTRVAEMAKLTENSFRDVNIAFANELSMICDRLEIDVSELIHLANHHPRVNILEPGPGVGGHCIAVDPWFIVHSAPREAQLIRTAREVNDAKPSWVINKIRSAINLRLQATPDISASDITIAAFGLAFKADIDDLRESPALEITRKLAAEHPGSTLVVEPNIRTLPEGLQRAQLVCQQEALDRADIVVLLVDHREFSAITSTNLLGLSVIDTRGLWRNLDISFV